MAVDNISHSPVRHIASFVTSGTFSVPEGVSKVYVTVEGTRGSTHGGGTPGSSHRASGYVEVIPNKTAIITIGATTSASNTTAGTTSFDGAITVPGSGSNTLDTRYGPSYGTGAAAAATSATTSLPTGAPGGAIVRVSSFTTASYTPGVGATGVVHIYG